MSSEDLTVSFDDTTVYSDDITVNFKIIGKVITSIFSKNTTIKDIKQWLQNREGIPTSMPVLIYSGARLKDDDTLKTYDIQNNETINIILNMRGD